MISLVDVEEQSFKELKELRDVLDSQGRRTYTVPMNKITLSEDGILHADRFEGPLAKAAMRGFLHTEGAPVDFVMNRCPTDLSVEIVNRLACETNTSITIQATNGVATGIMPADRQPIQYEMLIDRIGIERPIKEAVLSPDLLRITAVNGDSKELLPKDAFGFGWELVASEHGWLTTEVSRLAVRLICTNGLVGFDKNPVLRRSYNSRESVLRFLHRLVYVLDHEIRPPDLEPALKWAADRRIGREQNHVLKYLTQRLGGDATRLELRDVTEDTSWYELLNTITSLARLYSVGLRRRYEAEGGMLLHWFSRQGRGKPPWRRRLCEECIAWDSSDMTSPDITVGKASPTPVIGQSQK